MHPGQKLFIHLNIFVFIACPTDGILRKAYCSWPRKTLPLYILKIVRRKVYLHIDSRDTSGTLSGRVFDSHNRIDLTVARLTRHPVDNRLPGTLHKSFKLMNVNQDFCVLDRALHPIGDITPNCSLGRIIFDYKQVQFRSEIS